MTDAWTIGKVVKWAVDDFKQRGIDSARLDAELLLAHALGTDRMRVLVEPERPLSPDELGRYRELIKRRRLREPVAYLRGFREFYGRSFVVSKAVLIPRPDTEVLVETALARTAGRTLSTRALDLCTGSGCVAVTLAKERPNWHVTGSDVSGDALTVARENATRLGAVWNVRLVLSDLFERFAGERFELVTANPPYIPDAELETLEADVRDFEPRLALSGGADGHALNRRLVRDAPGYLVPGGVLAVEIMAGTGDAVAELFRERGFSDVRVDRDYAGKDRVVSGVLSAC